jgi:hypothetical protein
MTNVIDLKSRLSRDPAFIAAYAATAPNTITLQQALASGTASLRAVADWNERRGYDARDRAARLRHRAQAAALRLVANQVEKANVESYREAA